MLNLVFPGGSTNSGKEVTGLLLSQRVTETSKTGSWIKNGADQEIVNRKYGANKKNPQVIVGSKFCNLLLQRLFFSLSGINF